MIILKFQITLIIAEKIGFSRFGGIGIRVITEVETSILQLAPGNPGLAIRIIGQQNIAVTFEHPINTPHHVIVLPVFRIVEAASAFVGAEFLI